MNSGLDGLRSLALSADGKYAYTASRDDAAISRYSRSSGSGKLTFENCISGDLDTGPTVADHCKVLDSANTNFAGTESGLGAPESLVLPRGGHALFVSVAQDAGVARFARKPGSGKVTYKGCVTGKTGLPRCHEIPSATPGGASSGLDFPQFMAASHDGDSLYTAVGQDDAVATFRAP